MHFLISTHYAIEADRHWLLRIQCDTGDGDRDRLILESARPEDVAYMRLARIVKAGGINTFILIA